MAGRPRRSASDSLKGTTVPKETTEADATAPAGEEAAKTADAPAGGTAQDTTDVQGTLDGTDAPESKADAEDTTPPADDATGEDADGDDDLEDEDAEDDLVEAKVIVDAFNYFQDGTHQTARKGAVIVLERHAAERGLALNALAGTDDQD